MTIALGIDPGTSGSALALWGDDGPLCGEMLRAKGGIHGLAHQFRRFEDMEWAVGRLVVPDIIVVEGQQIDRRSKSKADILTLAQAAGVCIGWAVRRYPTATLLVPTPAEWKGGVAKHAHQARLYDDLGWGYTIIGSRTSRYARPVDPPSAFINISPGAWKDVGDAILLARWAHTQAS